MNNKKKIYKGGDVVRASLDVIDSMKSLGNSIFNEIRSITNIQSDINNVSERTAVAPTVSSPPPFNAPNL
jgi:hypothetical protein